MRAPLAHLVVVAALAAGCATRGAPSAAPTSRTADAPRDALNRAALELAIPLRWSEDVDGDGAVDPDELAVAWGLDPRPRDAWVNDGRFTAAFDEAWRRIRERARAAPSPPADPREEALARELAQRHLVVVEADFRAAPEEERALVRHVMEAARLVEQLYARQLGTLGMETAIPADDARARLAFFLNQGPWCSAPATESDPACSALQPAPPRRPGVYPADAELDPAFCAALARAPRGDELASPYTVVVRDASGLVPVPYHQAYSEEMAAVSRELRAAASALRSREEAALRAYLEAAARAFLTGEWAAAEEAWARTSAAASRWHLRVGPEAPGLDRCGLKAGFQLSFARVNAASDVWQRRLEPVRGQMERAIATLAGPPYVARETAFPLPELVDTILEAGAARSPSRAPTTPPPRGDPPAAGEERGHAAVAANLELHPERRDLLRRQAASVLCAATMSRYSDDEEATLLGPLLHEIAHELGPSRHHRVGGRSDLEIFGSGMASMLEELKAQSAALFLPAWLVERGVVARSLAEQATVITLVRALGHVSRGAYRADGRIDSYGALSAIQLGFLLQDGGLSWRSDAPAANGSDRGCLELEPAAFLPAVVRLAAISAGIKARGDAAAARALEAEFVKAGGRTAALLGVLSDRWRREPEATFVHAVRL